MRWTLSHHQGCPHGDHYDVFIELVPDAPLATWRLVTNPFDGPPRSPESYLAEAQRLADHRPIYLTFAGELSHQRGWVTPLTGGAARVAANPADFVVELRTVWPTASQQRTLRLPALANTP